MKVLASSRSRFGGLVRDKRANELAEFAVVIPVLLMVLIGMYWFGRAYNIYETITRAAREGARYASATPCALCTQSCNFPGMPPYPCTQQIMSNAIVPSLQASHLDPSQIISVSKKAPNLNSCFRGGTQPAGCRAAGPVCDQNQNVWVCHCVDMNPNGDPPECGTWVSFKYPFQFPFPFTGLDRLQIQIPVTVQMREER